MAYISDNPSKQLSAVTSNTTVIIPACYLIEEIIINNTTGNAIASGIKIGTTDGGVDVIASLVISANYLATIPHATVLKNIFSLTQDTTLFINSITVWNSASLNITFLLRKLVV